MSVVVWTKSGTACSASMCNGCVYSNWIGMTMDFSPEVGPPLSLADRLRFERGLDRFRESFNRKLVVVIDDHPEVQASNEQTDGLIWCHYLEDPGDMDEYWSRLRKADWTQLHRERKRLYELRNTADDRADVTLKAFGDIYDMLEERELPDALTDSHDDWLVFWDRYLSIWLYCLWLPIWNRLHALARMECYFHRVEAPPESLIRLVEEEEMDDRPGENPDTEKWDRRRRLAVKLLLEDDRSFDTVTEFRAVFAQEDEDLGFDPSSTRNYFKNRLDGEDRSTIEKWKDIALRFSVELESGIDLRNTGL